jgi:hypothetical protein
VKKIGCYYVPASQKTFLDLEMESDFYDKLETPFDNIDWHAKVHLCTLYGYIIINYAIAINMAVNMVICLEMHEYL